MPGNIYENFFVAVKGTYRYTMDGPAHYQYTIPLFPTWSPQEENSQVRIMPEVSDVESTVSSAESDVEFLSSDLKSIDINSDASSNAFRTFSSTDSLGQTSRTQRKLKRLQEKNGLHQHQTPQME